MTGQIVVVTLITVVDVNTSVALAAGQLVTLAAHLVMVYVAVVKTTRVVVPSVHKVREQRRTNESLKYSPSRPTRG